MTRVCTSLPLNAKENRNARHNRSADISMQRNKIFHMKFDMFIAWSCKAAKWLMRRKINSKNLRFKTQIQIETVEDLSNEKRSQVIFNGEL